ncbi:MAG: hypothetical protein ACON45_01295 [Paracoccaceae bacterium]
MSYNKTFKMGLRDIDLIETSLQQRLNELSMSFDSKSNDRSTLESEINEIRSLLGNLHNQKTWYRPKSAVYVSG